MNLDLDTRMKGYEQPFTSTLPQFDHVIMRLDGRAFHTYLRNLTKPFDFRFVEDMNWLTRKLCKHVSGVTLGYTCSDEISLLIQNLNPQGEHWFGGKVQKMVSVAAAFASGSMSVRRFDLDKPEGDPDNYTPVVFDARVFSLPTLAEVNNYFLWRQLDYRRNAVSMAARSVYSSRELVGKDTAQRIEMLADKGVDFFEYPATVRNGVLTQKNMRSVPISFHEQGGDQVTGVAVRTFWESAAAMRFVEDDSYILKNVSKSQAELGME